MATKQVKKLLVSKAIYEQLQNGKSEIKQEDMSSKEAECESLRRRIEEINNQLLKCQEEIKEKEEELTVHPKKIENLKEKLRKSDYQLDTKRRELANKLFSMRAVREIIGGKYQKLEEYKANLEDLEDMVSKLNKQSIAISHDLGKAYNDLDRLPECIDSLNEKKNNLDNEKKDLVRRLNDLSKEVNEKPNSDTLNKKIYADYPQEILLKCDYIRAALDPYDPSLLTDPKRGHWDLWDWDETHTGEGYQEIELKTPIIARDPADDINSSIVAIDFGTKSTVVVYRNDNNKDLPLQVGNGNYINGIQGSNYENPTILQFLDIKSFMEAYTARAGRPDTSWEQIVVSHEAFGNLKNGTSGDFYSYFTELKQYCRGMDREEKIKIQDKKGTLYDLPPYIDLGIIQEEFDPIEIYAYYLGLYINNMQQQKRIFMNYIMSFPVMYERNVREKILRSFRRGIMKSLPTALLNNEEAMAQFKLQEGCVEPAAYACTALREYGFEPEGDEKVYYGVFDFGGGTTDFDFGVLTEEDEVMRYDFRLTRFGENGDRTLGGENLLKTLAFEVFRKNFDKLLAGKDGAKIPFCMGPDSEEFVGLGVLIRNSREANQNMHNLMEALRSVWENPDDEDIKKILDSKKIKVTLFTENGKQFPNEELEMHDLDLKQMIKDRIEKGVTKFFIALRDAYDNNAEGLDPLSQIPKINIFLGGNSSKSKVVQELFKEYIENGTVRELLGFGEKQDMPEFILHMPLGMEDDGNLEKPTGKTGVAYGLLESAPSCGTTRVIDKLVNNSKETPFQLYIGRNRRNKFKLMISREADYKKWVKYTDASDDFVILYTDNPEVAGKKDVPITVANSKHVMLAKKDPNKFVFIKPVPSRSISYMVASSEEECLNPPEGADEPICIELE